MSDITSISEKQFPTKDARAVPNTRLKSVHENYVKLQPVSGIDIEFKNSAEAALFSLWSLLSQLKYLNEIKNFIAGNKECELLKVKQNFETMYPSKECCRCFYI